MFITKPKFFWIVSGILLLTAWFSVEAQAQPAPTDIQGNWAQKSIQHLVDAGVINGYPGGTFKPDQPITRAEFAKMVAKTFKYQDATAKNFTDVGDIWAKPYIDSVAAQQVMNAFGDGTFRPQNTLNRSQLATMLTRIVHLATPQEKYTQNWTPSFNDLPATDSSFRYVELVKRLGILPDSFQTEFHPNQPITRAEAAWMLKATNELAISKGKITCIDPNSGLVNVQSQQGDPVLAMLTPDSIVMRNNSGSGIEALLVGDDATVVTSPAGSVRYFKSFGQVTKNDLLSRISSMTKGKLTTDEVSALVSGDWASIKDNLKGSLYNRMIDMGLTPAEAESIMVQDWNYLDSLSRDRLAQALSKQLGITEDLSQALLSRDVQKIKEYGKIELATAALSKFLGVSGDSQNTSSDSNTY